MAKQPAVRSCKIFWQDATEHPSTSESQQYGGE
jgi:hypothetical protein